MNLLIFNILGRGSGGSSPVPDSAVEIPIMIGLSLSQTSINLYWSSVDADNYVLQRDTDINFSNPIEVYSGSDFSFENTGLTNSTTYYYRIKAQKSGFSDSAWSDTVTIIAGEIGAEFWYRGDDVNLSGSEVTQWNDRSDSNNAVQYLTRNTPNQITADLNGQDVVDFDSANAEILNCGAIAGITTYTLYLVFKADSTAGTQSILSNVQNISGTFLQQGFNVLINGNKIQLTNRSGVSQSRDFAFTDTTSYHVLTVKFNSSGAGLSRLVAKLDGLYKLDVTGLDSIVASTQNMYIGSNLGGTPNNFNGKIAEVFLFPTYHTELQEAAIYVYLNNRYAFTIPNGITNTEIYQNITYPSTIDSISNLFMRVCYDDSQNLPILILMHGFGQSATDFTDATLQRFKDYGYFVSAVGMRSWNGASGTRDASARELHDIYDAIQVIKQRFIVNVNQERVIMVGYSGGGGNVLGFVSKFPDVLCLGVDFFGISDYGYDATFGWYQQRPSNQASLEASIGDTPTNAPNEYKSRQHMWSASNHKGKLRIYHDDGDNVVGVNHSQRLVTQLIADGFTNYVYNESDSGDAERWLHGLPNAGVSPGKENIDAESQFVVEALTLPIPTIQRSGILKINGYLKTELFTIWLGDGTSSEDGRNRRATLVYNYNANSYTITPLIDSPETDMTVSIELDTGETASGTISSETTFNPA